MKIDVSSIVREHLATLHVAGKTGLSLGDFTLFYIVPVATMVFSVWANFEARSDAYNASLTFFGIFIALLLNIQVGMFAIFQRKWDLSNDKRVQDLQREIIEDRRILLTELNSNISYLVLVCCVALFASLLFYVKKWENGLAPAVMVLLYVHFILTLVMIVKRAHALFQKEYRDTPA